MNRARAGNIGPPDLPVTACDFHVVPVLASIPQNNSSPWNHRGTVIPAIAHRSEGSLPFFHFSFFSFFHFFFFSFFSLFFFVFQFFRFLFSISKREPKPRKGIEIKVPASKFRSPRPPKGPIPTEKEAKRRAIPIFLRRKGPRASRPPCNLRITQRCFANDSISCATE